MRIRCIRMHGTNSMASRFRRWSMIQIRFMVLIVRNRQATALPAKISLLSVRMIRDMSSRANVRPPSRVLKQAAPDRHRRVPEAPPAPEALLRIRRPLLPLRLRPVLRSQNHRQKVLVSAVLSQNRSPNRRRKVPMSAAPIQNRSRSRQRHRNRVPTGRLPNEQDALYQKQGCDILTQEKNKGKDCTVDCFIARSLFFG